MFRDVTFGQYYMAESFVHRMDARVKLVLCLLFMVGIFFVTSFAVFGAITLFLLVVIARSAAYSSRSRAFSYCCCLRRY